MPGVCHRCKRNVYVADEKVALGKVWHNFCVSCRRCRKLLDECTAQLYQDEIYCRRCYGVLCGRCDVDDEERRCGGRRSGCCRRCPTPARIPARAKPSPTAVTTWYSRGHSTQPCKACPRCSAKEPWYVCEGGSQRCPDGIGCERRSRPRTRTSSCDESCPARESPESSGDEKVCAAPKVVNASKPSPPCTCCNCCPERPRRRSCCQRCLRLEKADKEGDCSSRRRRSCDRSTCCAWRARRRAASPDSASEPPCAPCEPSDEERSTSRGRRSCDRSTCCPWRARRRTASPCSREPPPCAPCPPSDEELECRSRRRRSCDRSTCCAWKARRRTTSPCSRPEPPCAPCPPRPKTPPCWPCPKPPEPCRPCLPCPKTPEPPCAPCPVSPPKTPEPPCRPCTPPPCRPCTPPPCRPCTPPPCRPCTPPPCRPCTPPPCRPCPPPPCRPCPPPRCKNDGVEVLCPPADCCRCPYCCRRRRGRSCTSSDRSSKASSCPPCHAAKTRCCPNDLPIGRPCRRCGRQVYHAELVLAAGTVFHTCCFTCRQCRKPLESTTVYDAQNEIFCKQCYLKRFGPSGYGYGLGAGALQTP